MTNRGSFPKKERLSVLPDDAGSRLDRFVAARSGGVLSRSRAASLIEAGHVRLNGKGSKPAQIVRDGDRVEIEFPEPVPSHLVAEPIPLDIIFEDEHLIVLNKPAGLVVHPGSGVRSGTLVHALLHHSSSLSSGGAPDRPGIVHRLDKETSGLMVVAKTEQAHVRLSRDLAQREVRRTYGAIVWGEPKAVGVVDAPIARSLRDRKKMAVREGGRAALTRYRVAERFGFASRLDVELGTGRTHQIRVHLAHGGHPVFGDPQYGGRAGAIPRFLPPSRAKEARAALELISRQALHARSLAFNHPASGRPVVFESPFPADFCNLMERLRRPL